MKDIYLDNAATTALDPDVLETICCMLREGYGNPSSAHGFGRNARGVMETSRRTIASILNCAPSEIFFTSGGTEANNIIIMGAVRAYSIRHVISSPIEHHAVGHCLEALQEAGLITVSMVRLDDNGDVDYNDLERQLHLYPHAMVSLMHANNEIGNLTDLYRVAELCEGCGAYFHSDTVQSIGHYRHDMQRLKAHALTASAHKFHGPKGVGFAYINRNKKIAPYLYGGGQERGMRPGTENISAIAGLAKAMEIAYRDMDAHTRHIVQIKRYMIDRLIDAIPDVEFNGGSRSLDHSLYTVLNVSLPELADNSMTLFNLDLEHIYASGGSACSSGSAKPSHVISSLYPDVSREAVRFSFSKYTTRNEIDRAVDVLVALCSRPRAYSKAL